MVWKGPRGETTGHFYLTNDTGSIKTPFYVCYDRGEQITPVAAKTWEMYPGHYSLDRIIEVDYNGKDNPILRKGYLSFASMVEQGNMPTTYVMGVRWE